MVSTVVDTVTKNGESMPAEMVTTAEKRLATFKQVKIEVDLKMAEIKTKADQLK